MKRGEVVQVDFPFSDWSESKVRPALVIQSDILKLRDVIVAAISSTPSDTSIPLFPDEKTGIKKPCYVQCDKLHTLSRTMIFGAVGKLPRKTMKDVEECLRRVLGL